MTTIIYYPAGAYGTFIEWILTYLTDESLDDHLPFRASGNSHDFRGNLIVRNKDHADSMVFQRKPIFARTHTNWWTIDELLRDGHKILNVWWTPESAFWMFNNRETKCNLESQDAADLAYIKEHEPETYETLQRPREERFRHCLDEETARRYGSQDPNGLRTWQLREILSRWDFAEYEPCYFNPNGPVDRDNVCNIRLESLRDHFSETVLSLISELGHTPIPDRARRLDDIRASWMERQVEAFRDQEIRRFVDNTIMGIGSKISDLNFWEEAWIQQRLRERGYEIMCDDLDSFPTSTIEMNQLIYEHSDHTERV